MNSLVVRDNEASQYRALPRINAMLLNEFIKEHKRVESQQAMIAELKKGMGVLTAQLKEQAAQIQKVSAQIEMAKPASRLVANKP